jgi:hypothetical protein
MGWRALVGDDDGVTLVELVIAAFVLFVILTGVLGLVGQSTLMGAQAQEMNITNNAVNAYIERVRALPFEQVALVSATPPGALQPYERVTVAGYTITIVPTVSPGENKYLKELKLKVTVMRADGRTEEFATAVTIRDRTQYLTHGRRDPLTDPRASFISPTPPDDAVVWDSYWLDGTTVRPLTFAATASASEGRTISTTAIWCDDTVVLESVSGEMAEWIVNAQEWTISPLFTWNTLQTEEWVDEFGVLHSERIISDGLRAIALYAFDSSDINVFDIRYVLVDNDPPAAPGPPTALVKTDTSTQISWPISLDGTTPTDRYRIRILRQKTTAEFAADPTSAFTEITLPDGGIQQATVFSHTTGTPFSRYAVEVSGVSPRGLESADSGAIEQAYVTRPRLTGTYTVERYEGDLIATVDLAVTPPGFLTDGPPTYRWYWRTTAGDEYGPIVTSTPTLSETLIGPSGRLNQIEVWVEVQYRPGGSAYGGLVTSSVLSNKVGPTSASPVGWTPFGVGVWEW